MGSLKLVLWPSCTSHRSSINSFFFRCSCWIVFVSSSHKYFRCDFNFSFFLDCMHLCAGIVSASLSVFIPLFLVLFGAKRKESSVNQIRHTIGNRFRLKVFINMQVEWARWRDILRTIIHEMQQKWEFFLLFSGIKYQLFFLLYHAHKPVRPAASSKFVRASDLLARLHSIYRVYAVFFFAP